MIRVAFLTCHLVGTGHLVRTLALARAVASAGGEPLVITGGRPLPHVDAGAVPLVQIPPLVVEGFDFRAPRTPDGNVAGPAYLAERKRRIVQAVTEFRPHALVTETFPLGRRRQSGEFEAAIEAAGPGAAVIASVRDVPEPPGRPDRIAEAVERLRRRYDALLVHGDPALIPLEASWPLPEVVRPLVDHTGYVGRSAAADAEGLAGEDVLVSVGGGALGRRLIALALEAARVSARPWRVLVGGSDAATLAAALGRTAPANVTVEPARSDYRALLSRAAVSVSLAGYNTVTDLAGCATPAILVPFEEHGQREQRLRADRLAGLQGIRVRAADDLRPEDLAAAAEELATGPRRPALPISLDGAERAAARILKLATPREGAA